MQNHLSNQKLLANRLAETRDFAGAVKSYELIIQQHPDDVDSYVTLSSCHRLLRNFDTAEKILFLADQLEPNRYDVRLGLGILYREMGRPRDALALVHNIPDWNARYVTAHILLSLGNYTDGWRLHRDRWHSSLVKEAKPPCQFDRLDDIKGKPVVVLREGGHGDVFQMMRYIPLLAQHASDLLVFVWKNERRLMQGIFPHNVTIRLCSEESNVPLAVEPSYHHAVASLDLPYIFRTTIDTIPPPMRFYHRPNRQSSTRKKVGLVWAGREAHGTSCDYDDQRSIPLSAFQEFADLDNIEFINLQFGARANDLGLALTKVLSDNFDWLDTAKIIAELDLVIAVDTAVVHLAASIGTPTWLLSRFSPCWRWLCNQPTSPWYPHVLRVFGQTSFGNWQPTIECVKHELIDFTKP